MKVHYECAPCFLRQAQEALDLAIDDENEKLVIMSKLTEILCQKFNADSVSNEIGTKIHRTIKSCTGNPDPYSNQRVLSNKLALKFLPVAENILKENPTLYNYLKVSIAGNLLDFGALGLDADIEGLLLDVLDNDLTIDHSDELAEDLESADTLLFLADNVGEIVFDKLLLSKLQEYGLEITLALKEKPILNDACMEDALDVGLQEMAELITTGTDSVGIVYNDVSKEFLEIFYESDVIIAKGLGNFEGLTAMDLKDKNVYSLLNAKCEPIAREIGIKQGDSVVLKL